MLVCCSDEEKEKCLNESWITFEESFFAANLNYFHAKPNEISPIYSSISAVNVTASDEEMSEKRKEEKQ